MIDKTFVDAIVAQSHAAKRQAVISAENKTFLYNDKELKYEEIVGPKPHGGTVSTLRSLIALVREWAQRTLNTDGEWMTVGFTQAGGWFCANERNMLDVFQYERSLSDEWLRLQSGNTRSYPHADFVRYLTALRPFLSDAGKIIGALKSLDVSRVNRVVSSPVITDGKASTVTTVEMSVKMGAGGQATDSVTVPTTLDFRVPYAKGSRQLYHLEAELVPTLMNQNGREILTLGYAIPNLDLIMTDAIADEVAAFREAVKDLPRLLILENY